MAIRNNNINSRKIYVGTNTEVVPNDGDALISGKVGIGTTDPNSKLQVNVGTDQNIAINSHNSVARISSYNDAFNASMPLKINGSDLRFDINSSEKMRINSSGNVGIGPAALDTAGGDRLHVDGTLRVGPYFSSNDRDFIKLVPHGTDTKIISPNERFHIENTDGDIIINPSGNVGIGTTSPLEKLDVDNGVGRFTSANSADGTYFVLKAQGSGGALNNAVGITFDSEGRSASYVDRNKTAIVGESIGWSRNKLHFLQNNVADYTVATLADSVMTIDTNGNVGIGTTNPERRLHIDGSGGTAAIQIDKDGDRIAWLGTGSSGSSAADDTILQMHNEGVEKVRIFTEGNSWLNGGNVGIGTTSPSDGDLNINDPKLHVKAVDTSGAFSLAARFQGGGDANNTGTAIAINHSNDRGLLIKAGRKDSDRPVAYFDLIDSNGSTTNMLTMGEYGSDFNVGIGTTSPGYKLDVSGDIRIPQNEYIFFDNTAHYIRRGSSNVELQGYNGLELKTENSTRLLINQAGNVGIGTTDPSQKLHVSGNAYISGLTQSNTALMRTYSGHAVFGSNSTAEPIALARDGTNLDLVVSTSGNVGIGETNPDEKLEVVGSLKVGNIKIQNAVTGRIGLNRNTSTGAIYNSNYSAYQINGPTTSTGSLDIQSYSSTGSYLGVVSINSGNVTANNFILSSDETLKENIKDLDVKVDAKWRSYKFKDSEETRYGVIAQELEETNPELVRTNDEGLKSVAYVDLLIAKIAELEARLEKAGL